MSTNLQNFADGARIREKLLFDVVPQNHNKRRTLNLIGCDKTPLGYRLVFNVHHVRSDAKNRRPRKIDSVLLQIGTASYAGANFSATLAVVPHPLKIVPVEP